MAQIAHQLQSKFQPFTRQWPRDKRCAAEALPEAARAEFISDWRAFGHIQHQPAPARAELAHRHMWTRIQIQLAMELKGGLDPSPDRPGLNPRAHGHVHPPRTRIRRPISIATCAGLTGLIQKLCGCDLSKCPRLGSYCCHARALITLNAKPTPPGVLREARMERLMGGRGARLGRCREPCRSESFL